MCVCEHRCGYTVDYVIVGGRWISRTQMDGGSIEKCTRILPAGWLVPLCPCRGQSVRLQVPAPMGSTSRAHICLVSTDSSQQFTAARIGMSSHDLAMVRRRWTRMVLCSILTVFYRFVVYVVNIISPTYKCISGLQRLHCHLSSNYIRIYSMTCKNFNPCEGADAP